MVGSPAIQSRLKPFQMHRQFCELQSLYHDEGDAPTTTTFSLPIAQPLIAKYVMNDAVLQDYARFVILQTPFWQQASRSWRSFAAPVNSAETAGWPRQTVPVVFSIQLRTIPFGSQSDCDT
jgi:hypothetical protein